MALVVEDGTAKADAESYITVSDADDYHDARGNTAWADLTEAQKEAALRKAADFMVQAYRQRWAGHRVSLSQALDWPRYAVPYRDAPFGSYYPEYPSDEVPEAVKRACAELALRASSADLLADTTQTVKAVSAGSVSVTFADGSREGTKYPIIEGLLAPFFSSQGGVRLVRG